MGDVFILKHPSIYTIQAEMFSDEVILKVLFMLLSIVSSDVSSEVIVTGDQVKFTDTLMKVQISLGFNPPRKKL